MFHQFLLRIQQIKIDPLDTPKITFMSNQGNYYYYYNVVPFGLKNVGVTYQRLMDVVFAYQIGWNLELYINNMISKTENGHSHADSLEDIL